MPPRVAPQRKPLGEITTNPIMPQNMEPSTKKRKAASQKPQYDIDDDICQTVTISCNQVRAKIRKFLESGEMKVGEFQKAIGASSSTYSAFMRQNGPYKGANSCVYQNAFAFFKLRELNGVKIKKAKIGSAVEGGKGSGKSEVDTNFEDIELEGEEDNEVPVYDSCEEIRKKIRAYLKKTGMTQAAFGRELGKMFNPEKKVSGLAGFMGKKGPAAGNTNAAFYAGYVFFEKLRIRDGKPKSEHRLGMEDAWDGCEPYGSGKPGMGTKKVLDRVQYIGSAGSSLYQNEFGKPTVGW